ncbi:MAG: pilus assembly protein PilB, partial [Acidobacteria bacterium]
MNTFIDLDRESLDFELFKAIPVDLMFRYGFIPLREADDLLHIAVGSSFTLKELDELELRLNRRILHQLADEDKIREILKKSESSQRAL